jgi:hypothetical protein
MPRACNLGNSTTSLRDILTLNDMIDRSMFPEGCLQVTNLRVRLSILTKDSNTYRGKFNNQTPPFARLRLSIGYC